MSFAAQPFTSTFFWMFKQGDTILHGMIILLKALTIISILHTKIFIMRKLLLVFALTCFMAAPASVMAASVTRDVAEVAKETSNEPAIGTIQDAMKEFKNLSKKERKARVSLAKEQMKQFKAQKASGAPVVENTLLLVIITILLPPLGVYLHEGEANGKFWLSLLLWLLFYIPGLIYGLIVVLG